MRTADRNRVESLAVPGRDDVLLGLAQHKAFVTGTLRVWRNFTVNPTLLWLGQRYAYAAPYDSIAGRPTLHTLPAQLIASLMLRLRDVGTEGLDLAVGVHDLFGANMLYPQPYDAGHAPLPGPPTELLMKVEYSRHF